MKIIVSSLLTKPLIASWRWHLVNEFCNTQMYDKNRLKRMRISIPFRSNIKKYIMVCFLKYDIFHQWHFISITHIIDRIPQQKFLTTWSFHDSLKASQRKILSELNMVWSKCIFRTTLPDGKLIPNSDWLILNRYIVLYQVLSNYELQLKFHNYYFHCLPWFM